MNFIEKMLVGAVNFFDDAKKMADRDRTGAIAKDAGKTYPKITEEEFMEVVTELQKKVCLYNLPYLRMKGVCSESELAEHIDKLANQALLVLFDRISFFCETYGKKAEFENIIINNGNKIEFFNQIPDFKGYLNDACDYTLRKMQMS